MELATKIIDMNDGYCGNWDPDEIHANPKDFKKIATPTGRTTTMVVKEREGAFFWECVECGEEVKTEKFSRPFHVCEIRLDK